MRYTIWTIRNTEGNGCNHLYYERYAQDINTTYKEIEQLLDRYYNVFGVNKVEFETRVVE